MKLDEAKFETDLEKLTAVYVEGAKAPLLDIVRNLEADAADPPPTIRGCGVRFNIYARQLTALLVGKKYNRE